MPKFSQSKKLFKDPLYVGVPNIPPKSKLIPRIIDILNRKWLTNNGKYLHQFENRLSAILGVKHCIATCNATTALEVAAKAMGLKGEVIVPSFTFVATANILKWHNIEPVFCDVNIATHNIDESKIVKLITKKTTGILAVNLWGRPCNIEKLEQIAKKCRIKLLFDSSHAFGCSYKNHMIGNYGDAEVFSFHATKFINTFEGGLITTNNDVLAKTIRLMINFGFSGYDCIDLIGINGKMNEVSAAMGVSSLENMKEIVNVNYRNYVMYRRHLGNVPGVKISRYDEREKNNYQYIVIEIDEDVLGISRDKIIKILWQENVIARKYFYPGCHNMTPYKKQWGGNVNLCQTNILARSVIVLPTGKNVSVKNIDKICNIIESAIADAR